MHEDDFSQGEWDKAKIIKGVVLSLIFASLIFYCFKIHLLGLNIQEKPTISVSDNGRVKGAQTQNIQNPNLNSSNVGSFTSIPSSSSIQSSLDDKVSQIKQEVSNLNVAQVASSSPQVQKILEDVKSLEQYPQNQAKEACFNICNSL